MSCKTVCLAGHSIRWAGVGNIGRTPHLMTGDTIVTQVELSDRLEYNGVIQGVRKQGVLKGKRRMQNLAEHDYKVLLTHSFISKTNTGMRWRATLLDFPTIVEEARSRDQAIQQIKQRIIELLAHAEIITLHAPALPVETQGNGDELTAQGWNDHGLFKDDQAALQLFDEIERARDSQLVGDA